MIYLINAASNIYSTIASERSSTRDLAYAARVGCQTLKDLANDRTFKDHVELLANLRKDQNFLPKEDIEAVQRDLRHFHEFIDAEMMIIEKAGFSKEVAEEIKSIIVQEERLTKNLSNWTGNSKTLFRNIRLIRDSTCNFSKALQISLQQSLISEDDQKKREIKKQIKRSFYVIAGGAVLFLNATSSLSSGFMLLSSAVGSGLISQAIPPV